jgi:IMP cyclohydrolase
MEEYTVSQIEKLKAEGVAGEALAKQVAEMDYWKEMYKNPLIRAAMTFMEIFPVGLIIALLCAAILRKSEGLPARS